MVAHLVLFAMLFAWNEPLISGWFHRFGKCAS